MKTDDDTYVNISKILNLVENISPITQNPTCLSHFHHNRAVPHWGKWADYDYPSSTYPVFPSGSGYLLTGNHYLKTLQNNAFILIYLVFLYKDFTENLNQVLIAVIQFFYNVSSRISFCRVSGVKLYFGIAFLSFNFFGFFVFLSLYQVFGLRKK